MLRITIPGNPITKKNHSMILKTKDGRTFIAPSKQYIAYEKAAGLYMNGRGEKINTPVCVRGMYYMETRRRVDLLNLLAATCDILVHYGVLEDDNSQIVVSHDGSRVLYDRENPRAEIYITEVDT